MILKRFVQSLGVVSLLLLFVPVSASALVANQNELPGASNAADYQPPTGNPQNDVGGVSQGQSNQNNLQKPGSVDQTALPNVPDLRVDGVTGEANTNTTKTEVGSDKQQRNAWGVIFLGVAAVAVVVLILTSGKDRVKKKPTTVVAELTNDEPTDELADEPTTTTIETMESEGDVEATPVAKKAPTTPKKTTKRKKSKGKKTKRKR